MPDRIPVMVGITTLPSRIAFMRPGLESLLNGNLAPDGILVSVPQVSVRENTAYVIPEFFQELSRTVEIVRTEQDYGSGTKLLGMLGKITQPSYIVLADDDVTYKRFFLRRLVEHQRLDHHASFSFFTYSMAGLPVGQGVDGFSFWSPNLEGIFDFYKNHIAGTDLMFHDDLWISFFLMSRGISIKSLRSLLDEAGAGEVREAMPQAAGGLSAATGRLSRERLNSLISPLFDQVKIPKEILQASLTLSPDEACICSSGKSYGRCHGA